MYHTRYVPRAARVILRERDREETNPERPAPCPCAAVQLARGSGLTRDVSAGGVYFLTDQAYRLDSQLDLTLVFGATLPESPIQVQCQARVVRVEPRSDGVGIAAAITSFSFA